MLNKKVNSFLLYCFSITFITCLPLIVFSRSEYYYFSNWVSNFQQLLMNIPFSIYILSPAISSFIVLHKCENLSFQNWLFKIFTPKIGLNNYLYVLGLLALYFGLHIWLGGIRENVTLVSIILSIPGGLIIGGMEEAGWMYILQPFLVNKYGNTKGTLVTAIIWTIWHIPLFFIAGTNHSSGEINFYMFTVQLFSFRFIHTSFMYRSEKFIFMSILFHTLFNAISPLVGPNVMNWSATILVNFVILLISIIVTNYYKN